MDRKPIYSRKKVFVKVVSAFDLTGYMQPQRIVWDDGKVSDIDEVTDYRPASTLEPGLIGDVYTVVVKGRRMHLFFEKTDPRFAGRIGRWFVEPMVVDGDGDGNLHDPGETGGKEGRPWTAHTSRST